MKRFMQMLLAAFGVMSIVLAGCNTEPVVDDSEDDVDAVETDSVDTTDTTDTTDSAEDTEE